MLGWRIETAENGKRKVGMGGGGPFPLAYCTDVSGIPPESWGLFEGVRTLVIGALRHRHHPTHFTIDQALNAAAQIGAEQTWFVHMSHEVRHAEVDSTLPEDVRLAYDGLVLGA
jgi:phosphoribosyl 1,2-cyclic phosphate phosphodiesterase